MGFVFRRNVTVIQLCGLPKRNEYHIPWVLSGHPRYDKMRDYLRHYIEYCKSSGAAVLVSRHTVLGEESMLLDIAIWRYAGRGRWNRQTASASVPGETESIILDEEVEREDGHHDTKLDEEGTKPDAPEGQYPECEKAEAFAALAEKYSGFLRWLQDRFVLCVQHRHVAGCRCDNVWHDENPKKSRPSPDPLLERSYCPSCFGSRTNRKRKCGLVNGEYDPISDNAGDLAAEYLKIDLQKVEEEKRRLLDLLQELDSTAEDEKPDDPTRGLEKRTGR